MTCWNRERSEPSASAGAVLETANRATAHRCRTQTCDVLNEPHFFPAQRLDAELVATTSSASLRALPGLELRDNLATATLAQNRRKGSSGFRVVISKSWVAARCMCRRSLVTLSFRNNGPARRAEYFNRLSKTGSQDWRRQVLFVERLENQRFRRQQKCADNRQQLTHIFTGSAPGAGLSIENH